MMKSANTFHQFSINYWEFLCPIAAFNEFENFHSLFSDWVSCSKKFKVWALLSYTYSNGFEFWFSANNEPVFERVWPLQFKAGKIKSFWGFKNKCSSYLIEIQLLLLRFGLYIIIRKKVGSNSKKERKYV